MGILTRNSLECALITLEAIGVLELFEPLAILGRDEAPPKPEPEGILALMRFWRAQPDETLMVGDFRYDLEAGRAAQTATVHVDWRDADWPAVTDLKVRSLTELVDALEQP